MFFIKGNTDDRSIITQETFDYFDSIVAVDRLNNNSQLEGQGSGVLIDAKFILTAAHVIFNTETFNSNNPTFSGARISFADDVPNVNPIRAISSSTPVPSDTVNYDDLNTENGLNRILP